MVIYAYLVCYATQSHSYLYLLAIYVSSLQSLSSVLEKLGLYIHMYNYLSSKWDIEVCFWWSLGARESNHIDSGSWLLTTKDPIWTNYVRICNLGIAYALNETGHKAREYPYTRCLFKPKLIRCGPWLGKDLGSWRKMGDWVVSRITNRV